MAIQKLYKYLSISDPNDWGRRRLLLAERKLYFSDPATFNDPFDCNFISAQPYKGMLRSNIRVFCLSGERCDDSLMFAHYGDSHRGFRLTFEIDTDKTLREIGVLGRGRFVIYGSKMPEFDRTNIHESLLIKSESWKYEAEYRIFAADNDVLVYDQEALVEVAFGFRMNRDFEPVIRNWIAEGRHKRVKYLQAVASKDLIRFDYVET